ncbi:MAG: CDP-alcohol phosphatidyltransferase family protein [FCB group bacterium]|jgi:CDP-diacylglycerol--glycerol-3-phosphate 3-phosphatidyltransferase
MLNISNSLSFFRLLLAIPLGFALWYDSLISTVIICLLAYISDLLDGYFARKLDQVTEAGKIIDPIADKIFIAVFAIILILKGMVPLWFALAVLSRDILILIGGLYLSRKIKYVVPSDFIGKAAVFILGLTLVGILFKIDIIKNYGIYLTLIVMFISLINYFFRMLKILREHQSDIGDNSKVSF